MTKVTDIADVRQKTARKMGELAPTEPKAIDPLRCVAPGCPNRWSCDMGNGRLCSWHDAADRRDWPEITAELVDLLSRGIPPQRPQLGSAKWIQAAAERARQGLKGDALRKAMQAPEPGSFAAADLAERKQRAQELTDRYQRERGHTSD